MTRVRGSWWGLGVFWIVVVAAAGGGALWLTWKGPPPVAGRPAAVPAAPQNAAPRAAPASGPQISIVLGGFGLVQADSEAAIRDLPASVAFAVSAYARDPATLSAEARKAGHEVLASIPMEPNGYPTNDEGPDELLTGASASQNQQKLDQVLARVPGAVGATGASDGQSGERFASMAPDLDAVEQALAARQWFYIDPRPGQPSPKDVAGRTADVDLDGSAAGPGLGSGLVALEKQARSQGTALGVLGLPRPLAVDQIAAWARGLAASGIALVPPSVIVQPPKAPAR